MSGVLTGVIHDGERAYNHERNCAQDDEQRCFHRALERSRGLSPRGGLPPRK